MAVKRKNTLHSQKGLATIETLPLIVIFVILFSYGMGLFGVIHSAILYSIGARAYAFETFRHRTNLVYFRGNIQTPETAHYLSHEIRQHGIVAEGKTYEDQFVAGKRPITFGRNSPDVGNNEEEHNQKIHNLQRRNRTVGTSPVWLMVTYGMCLNANCGD